MNSGLRFFKQAVRLGLLDGTAAREAYRASREQQIAAQQYVLDHGLLDTTAVQRIVAGMQHEHSEPLPVVDCKPSDKPFDKRLVPGYLISQRLGIGGMGSVYLAEQQSMARPVALKVLSPQYSSDEGFTQRFMREARAAGRVNDRHVVTCFDAGRHGDILYMALELVRGGDAHQLLEKEGGHLPERRALEIARDCARGLVAIAKAGLVHRDIKPSNILLDELGLAKLGDLGLARDMAEDDNISVSGEIFGTPAYMSPEHARGDTDLDIRTDIYSLMASLFTLLTGRQPFVGKSSLDIASKVLHQAVPDVRDFNPAVSAAAARLLMRGMAKERELRHQDAEALVADLDSILDTGRSVQVATSACSPGAVSILWKDRVAVLIPGGALGQNDNQHWNDALENVIGNDANALVVDCGSVQWVSSEGLALLVRLCSDCKTNDIGFGICNLNESTDRAIRIVQLHRLLPIFVNLDDALEQLTCVG